MFLSRLVALMTTWATGRRHGVTFIHGNYIKRVRNMQSVIQRELQLPTVN